MNKVVKVLVGVTMMAGLFVTNVEAKGMSETGNNVLKTGKVVAIEYSENPPDNEYFGEVENGTCIGEIKDVEVNDAGMMIDFQDNTGLWYELDDKELTEHLYDLAKSLKGIVNKRLSAKR